MMPWFAAVPPARSSTATDWCVPSGSYIGVRPDPSHCSNSPSPARSSRRDVSAAAPVVYYVFDLIVIAGRDVMHEALEKRRELLESEVLPKLTEPVRYASSLDADLAVLIQSVKAHGFEGLVAKRRDSACEPGLRSGVWMKMPVNRHQES